MHMLLLLAVKRGLEGASPLRVSRILMTAVSAVVHQAIRCGGLILARHLHIIHVVAVATEAHLLL